MASNFTVKFEEYGDPLDVLKHEVTDIPKVTDGCVLLKVLGEESPILLFDDV